MTTPEMTTAEPPVYRRYPTDVVRADAARAGAGLLLMLTPFAFVRPHWVVTLLLLAGAALFAVFAARTAQRALAKLELDDTGILLHAPMGAALRWEQITSVDLRFYAVRRDRKDGWLHLTVKGRTTSGQNRRIDVESTLEGFDAVATAVAAAADRNGLTLSDTTKANFLSLGILVRGAF